MNLEENIEKYKGHAARMGEMKNAYKIFVGNPEGLRPRGRLRRRWEDNIRMNLTEIGWESVDWIHMAQDRERWRALDGWMVGWLVYMESLKDVWGKHENSDATKDA